MAESNDNSNPMKNIVSIDEAKLRKMKRHGNTIAMLERFEMLRLKLIYDQAMDSEEARELVLLTKYFMDNGPSEPFRFSCKLLYEKYMKPFNL